MSARDCDLFVIGAGSGGVRAARLAAGQYGMRVAIAECGPLGGTCVNLGCIPKKLLFYGAEYDEHLALAPAYGWRLENSRFDWGRLVGNKDREIARLNEVYRDLLQETGVVLVEGRAKLRDAHTVRVGEREWAAEHVLIATGSRAVIPPVPGAELAIISDNAFHLEHLPPRVAIIGGGYIAVEFAGIFSGMGSEVVLLYRGPLFLRGFEDDLRRFLADRMRAHGVEVRFSADVTSIKRNRRGLDVRLRDGGNVRTDCVMYATGRQPATADLGLEELGVRLTGNGAIAVDEHYASSVPSVHALGDVIDRVKLTPVALAEAGAFVATRFGNRPVALDYTGIPTAVFSRPELGTVGLTEEQARARHGRIEVYRSEFVPLRHTLGKKGERAMVKLIVESSGRRVVGAHLAGSHAGEIVQGLAVAMKAGATKEHFDTTIGVHPTLAEEFVSLRHPSTDRE